MQKEAVSPKKYKEEIWKVSGIQKFTIIMEWQNRQDAFILNV